MGGGGSQTINQTFNMDILNETINETIVNTATTLSASMGNVQKVKVVIGEMGPKCEVNSKQDINAKSQTSVEMEAETAQMVRSKVESELQASADAAMEKVTEAGNMQFGDKQNMNQTINMELKNIIKNTFETNTLSQTISEVVNLQEGVLEIKKCNGKIDFSQNVVAELQANAITKSLSKQLNDSETMSKLAAAASGSQKTENKGIADIVDSIGNAFNGPLKYAMIASVVCCLAIVAMVVAMALSPGGQKGMSKGMGGMGGMGGMMKGMKGRRF
jgi:hypothetical protein